MRFSSWKKALAVGDEILKVPELRPVHRRIIDFGDDAVPKRKPDPAGRRISGPHPIFSPVRPFGLYARRSKGLRLVGYISKIHFLIRFSNLHAGHGRKGLAEILST